MRILRPLIAAALLCPVVSRAADTQMSTSQLQTLFADGQAAGSITPGDIRDLAVSTLNLVTGGTVTGPVIAPVSGSTVTATGGTTARMLGDWFAGMSKSGSKTLFPGGVDLGGTKTGATNSTLGFTSGQQTVNSATITGSFAPLNILQMTEAVSIPLPGGAQGVYYQLNTGGTAATGNREAFQSDMTVYTTTGNNGGQYTGVTGNFYGTANDLNGIGYGGNFVAQLSNNASTWAGIVGAEFDVGIQTGASAQYQTGLSIVQLGNDTVAGSQGKDAALVMGMQAGSIGWDYGYAIDGISGQFPIKTTGTLMAARTAGTITNGFDLSNLTISGKAWISSGASLDGTGNWITKSTAVVGSANKAVMTGAATGNNPTFYSQGTDTNVGLTINMQGTGNFNILSGAGANTVFQAYGIAGSDGYVGVVPGVSTSTMDQFYINGVGNNLLLGGPLNGGAMATTAASGFPAMPFTAGTPTGTPVNSGAGAVFEVNSSTKTLNIYIPGVGWYHAALTAAAG